MCENYHGAAGVRVYNVKIGNVTILSNFDSTYYVGNLAPIDSYFELEISNGVLFINDEEVEQSGFSGNTIKIDMIPVRDQAMYSSLLLIRKEYDDYMYYIDEYAISCKNVSYTVYADEPFLIPYTDLIKYSKLAGSSNDGIIFRYKETDNIGGSLKESNSTQDIIADIVTFNDDKYYQYALYLSEELGEHQIKYALKARATANYFYSSSICAITMVNECYFSCDTCSDIGTEEEHKCTKCKKNYYFIEGTTNCIRSAPYGYYLDKQRETFTECVSPCGSCTSRTQCTSCTEGYVRLSTYTNIDTDLDCVETCLLDISRWYIDTNTNEFHCLVNSNTCPSGYLCYNRDTKRCFPSGTQGQNCGIEMNEDNIMEYVDANILDCINDNFTYSSENISVNLFKSSEVPGQFNLSTIDLGECEDVLKEKYNITSKEDLLIAQLDRYNTDNPTNEVEFMVYTQDGKRLDMSYCQGTNIDLSCPLKLGMLNLSLSVEEIQQFQDKGIDVFDPECDFFNDKCFNFTSFDSGTDVTLGDRKNKYYQNVSLCSEGCTYEGINLVSMQVSCKCNGSSVEENNTKITTSFGKNVYNKFSNVISKSNLSVIKCYHIVFDVKIKKEGDYIFCIMWVVHVSLLIYYLIQKNVIYAKFVFSPCSPPNTDIKDFDIKSKATSNYAISPTTACLTTNDDLLLLKNQIKSKTSNKVYSDEELSYLPLGEAIEKDKRTFAYFFLYRVKKSHPIYLAFFARDDCSIKPVVISQLVFNIQLDLCVNALFYSDDYISNSTEKDGDYDIVYNIIKIMYSTAIGLCVSLVVNIFAVKFKKGDDVYKNIEDLEEKRMKQINKMILMIYIYFVLILLFSGFFWYFASAFCGVYQNSQTNWLIDSIISFVIGMALPFITALLTTIVRKMAIKLKIELLYHISLILEELF